MKKTKFKKQKREGRHGSRKHTKFDATLVAFDDRGKFLRLWQRYFPGQSFICVVQKIKSGEISPCLMGRRWTNIFGPLKTYKQIERFLMIFLDGERLSWDIKSVSHLLQLVKEKNLNLACNCGAYDPPRDVNFFSGGFD